MPAQAPSVSKAPSRPVEDACTCNSQTGLYTKLAQPEERQELPVAVTHLSQIQQVIVQQ